MMHLRLFTSVAIQVSDYQDFMNEIESLQAQHQLDQLLDIHSRGKRRTALVFGIVYEGDADEKFVEHMADVIAKHVVSHTDICGFQMQEESGKPFLYHIRDGKYIKGHAKNIPYFEGHIEEFIGNLPAQVRYQMAQAGKHPKDQAVIAALRQHLEESDLWYGYAEPWYERGIGFGEYNLCSEVFRASKEILLLFNLPIPEHATDAAIKLLYRADVTPEELPIGNADQVPAPDDVAVFIAPMFPDDGAAWINNIGTYINVEFTNEEVSILLQKLVENYGKE